MPKALNQPKPVYEEVSVDPWRIFIFFYRTEKTNKLDLRLPFDCVAGENRNGVMKKYVTWWRQYEAS